MENSTESTDNPNVDNYSEHTSIQSTEGISHRVGHVLLAFGMAINVNTIQVVLLPTGIHTMQEYLRCRREIRVFDELPKEDQALFPLKQTTFVGLVYDEPSAMCTRLFTSRTTDQTRKKAPNSFDWLCCWCIQRLDLCTFCEIDISDSE
jgi:hypothetical protein